MVDIHSHVLPGVDDGAESMETALAMLRGGAREGIEAAVLTPHFKAGDGSDKDALHRRCFAELEEAVRREGLPIEIHLGAEVGFRFGLAAAAAWPSVPLAAGPYVLVDLPPGPLSPGLERGFFELRAAGFKPILAHPERQRQLARNPAQLQRLRRQDLLCQIDAGSLCGRFGRRALQMAETMVRRGWADFVGSDGHDLDKRPFSLVAARARVEELRGAGEVQRLFADNPRRVVRGEAARREIRRPGSPRRGVLRRLFGA